MASSKLVTTKEQGFQMMADYINHEAGCNWTRAQCEGKYRCVSSPCICRWACEFSTLFRNWERNFKAAKAYSLSSGIGIDDADRKKGITTMPEKMEHMCHNYELWDSWFGSKQKYNPTNVQAGGANLSGDDEPGSDDGNGSFPERDLTVLNDEDGGVDGREGDQGNDGGSEVSSQPDAGASDLAPSHASSLQSAAAAPSADSSPRQATVAAAPAAAAAGGAGASRRGKQNQAAATEAKVAAAAVANALSTSPSTQAKADKFDATYSAVQHRKIEMMRSIETSRCDNAILLQVRDQVFQGKLVAVQQKCKDADALAERRLRQRISYETNLSQLLQKDTSGALADDFDARIARQLQSEAQRADREAQANSGILDALMDSLQRN